MPASYYALHFSAHGHVHLILKHYQGLIRISKAFREPIELASCTDSDYELTLAPYEQCGTIARLHVSDNA